MGSEFSQLYGVRSQAFFDVLSIALRHGPVRDELFSGLKSVTLICAAKAQHYKYLEVVERGAQHVQH